MEGGKKGGRERKKHVTLIISLAGGPHSLFFPPFFFLCHPPLSEDVHEYDREVCRGDANSEIKRMISLGKKELCGGDRRRRSEGEMEGLPFI